MYSLCNNLIPAVFVAFLLLTQAPPAVAGEENAAGRITVLVDTVNCRLLIFKDTTLVAKHPVAVGKFSTLTPVGNWQVVRKAMNWGSGFGSRWMGLNVPWGLYGIHGTNKPWSVGTHASAGCIRMLNQAVEQVYPLVSPGTQVVVLGNPFGYGQWNHRTLRNGDVGADVMQVQRGLIIKGVYAGPVHGIFDAGVEQAVVKLRKMFSLPYDNCVDGRVYALLGL